MSNFRPIDRHTAYLLPPSVEDWLPKDHLARFVVDVVDQLDLSAMSKAYRGSGSASYHPCLLVGLLVYGYATGVFSSRKLERATYDSVAFRFVAANRECPKLCVSGFRSVLFSVVVCFFSALKKQNGRQAESQTARWRRSIRWVFSSARPHSGWRDTGA